jgi:hypothetical protein
MKKYRHLCLALALVATMLLFLPGCPSPTSSSDDGGGGSALSDDASLSALGVLWVGLGPFDFGFVPTTTSYDLDVPNSLTQVDVTPVANDAGATIVVNGTSVASGTPITMPFAVGSNVIDVVVTAEDGTTVESYTVTVDRAASDPTNPDLAFLIPSGGSLSPDFDKDTVTYTVGVSYAVDEITFTPFVSDSTATVQVDGNDVTHATASDPVTLNYGGNGIDVVVTAGNGTPTKTYSVVVNRASSPPSDNADLSNLVPSEGTLSPAFNSATTAYTVDVDNSVTSITFTPTAADSGATIMIDATPVASGSPSPSIALSEGSNVVVVVVTAEDAVTTKNYTVTVTREGPTGTTISILDPEDLDVVSGTIIISGTYTGPVTTIELWVDDDYEDDVSFSAGTWSYIYNTTGLFDTYHLISVEANPGTAGESYDDVIVETDNNVGSGIDVSGTISMDAGGPTTISESAPLIIFATDVDTDELGPAEIILSGSFPYTYTLEDFEDGEYEIGAFVDSDGDLEISDGDYAWSIDSIVIYGTSIGGVDFTLREYPYSYDPGGEINIGLYNADAADGQTAYVAIVVYDGSPDAPDPADVLGTGSFVISDGFGITFISEDGINPYLFDSDIYEAYFYIDANGNGGDYPDLGELAGWIYGEMIGNSWYFFDYITDLTPFGP